MKKSYVNQYEYVSKAQVEWKSSVRPCKVYDSNKVYEYERQ